MWNCDGSWIDCEELERIRWNLKPRKAEVMAYDCSTGVFETPIRNDFLDASTYIAKRENEDKENTQLHMNVYCGRRNGKTLTQYELSFKSLTQEDYKQMAAMETAIENVRKEIERAWIRQPVNKFFDIKSIEVSADHRTVVVVWTDGETTKVVRSENDPDDIYMAFTAALAKKLYGSNIAIKRTISKKMNQHKPNEKKEAE